MTLIWIRQAEYKIEANYYHTDTGLKFMSENPPSPLKELFQAGKWGLRGGEGGAVVVRMCGVICLPFLLNLGFILCLQLKILFRIINIRPQFAF